MNKPKSILLPTTFAEAKEYAQTKGAILNEIAIGQYVRQGYVYLCRVDDIQTFEKTLWSYENQVVNWDSKDKRHMVCSKNPNMLFLSSTPQTGKLLESTSLIVGAFLEAKERFLLVDPIHCPLELPEGNYQAMYQSFTPIQ